MSFPASIGDIIPTITEAEITAAASSIGITIPRDQLDTYLKFASAFDSGCREILSLPPFLDPRLDPIETTTPRSFTTPSPESNALNAWSQRCSLIASHPTSNKLAGKTIALKANISIAGADLNIGTAKHFFPGSRFHVPQIDATVVRRILEAGATVKGTGTCENFSLSAVSVTAETGPVRNAWDVGRVTGGSSSGVTSLVSVKDVNARLQSGSSGVQAYFEQEEGVDLAVGGDQGGSIRVPAHLGGIYGLKPTFGLVPYTGVASLFPSIDHAGPMGRSIEDLALLLEVIAGADGLDFRQGPWTPLRENVPSYLSLLEEWITTRTSAGNWTSSTAGKGMRIGILQEGWEIAGLEAGVASTTRSAVERFSSLGADIVPISVPMHKLAGPLWAIYNRPALLATLSNQPASSLGYPMPGFEPLAPRVSGSEKSVLQEFFEYISPINPAISNALLNAPLLGQKYGAELSRKATMHVHELTTAFDRAFEENNLDVIVLPVSGKVAPKVPEFLSTATEMREGGTRNGGGGGAAEGDDIHKGSTGIRTTATPEEAAKSFVGVTLNTCGFNMTGHPAMSLPCGWTEPHDGAGPDITNGKMPVGLQIVGRKWDEMAIFKAASVWEVGGRGLDRQ